MNTIKKIYAYYYILYFISLNLNFSPLSHHVPDFLVIGYHGRKSEERAGNKIIMGSSANHLIREVHMPCIIVKKVCTAEKRTYVMAVDRSNRAKEGLSLLLTLVRPNDTLIIAHVEEVGEEGEDSSAAIKAYYESEIKYWCPPDSKFVSLTPDNGKSTVDKLIEYADEIDPDFLVLAPAATKEVTCVTEPVLLRTTASVILCKS